MINVVGLATMLAKHGFGAKDQQDYQVLVQSVCDACKDSDSVKIMSALHLLMDDDKIHDAIVMLNEHANPIMLGVNKLIGVTDDELLSLAEQGELSVIGFIVMFMRSVRIEIGL